MKGVGWTVDLALVEVVQWTNWKSGWRMQSVVGVGAGVCNVAMSFVKCLQMNVGCGKANGQVMRFESRARVESREG